MAHLNIPDTFVIPKTQEQSYDITDRALSLNSLQYENRVSESCKTCEIIWSYYKSTLYTIQSRQMLFHIGKMKHG